MFMSKLSVVINTKNAAKTLERTLESVKSFADEIVLVDMESTDDTLKIAKKFSAQIFEHKDVGYVEPARNFAISKAKGSWILILDADEELGSELKRVINRIITGEVSENAQADCYYLARKNLIFGKWIQHSGWWPDYQLRLFKSGYVEWLDDIHSIPVTQGVVKQFPARESLAILHHNYESVHDFLQRLNRYTDIQAENLKNAKTKPKKQEILAAFTQEFLSRFFAQDGIKDGSYGLSLSLLQAMSEAVVGMKLEFDQDSQVDYSVLSTLESMRSFQKDLNYWIADYHVAHGGGLKKLYWQFRRKFKL